MLSLFPILQNAGTFAAKIPAFCLNVSNKMIFPCPKDQPAQNSEIPMINRQNEAHGSQRCAVLEKNSNGCKTKNTSFLSQCKQQNDFSLPQGPTCTKQRNPHDQPTKRGTRQPALRSLGKKLQWLPYKGPGRNSLRLCNMKKKL